MDSLSAKHKASTPPKARRAIRSASIHMQPGKPKLGHRPAGSPLIPAPCFATVTCEFLGWGNAFLMFDEEGRAHKLAANQSRFRRLNERFARAAHSHGFQTADRVPFLCECADPGCFEAVMLSIEEYEQVWQHPSRFVLVAGHEDPDAAHEQIIEAERGYAIVQKVSEAGAHAARFHAHDATF
jgi:hypothetical protein